MKSYAILDEVTGMVDLLLVDNLTDALTIGYAVVDAEDNEES